MKNKTKIKYEPKSDAAGNDMFTVYHAQTFIQRILNKPATVKTYFGRSTVWFDADTGIRARTLLEAWIVENIEFMKHKGVW